ncbi:MAG: thioredoxin domain-containing protein [Phycisphaerales bacterium JB039]
MATGNQLAHESSPYLLQHAHNPVHWKPWGEAAFAEARQRDVPIFLSVGYSTCHWCHVMERESFESEAIGQLMNELFVCVKVDREERPDVDEPYMLATQLMTGSGGWPMSVFLEPGQLRPFWCATYLPPEPRGQMPGFPQALEAISRAWRERREEVLEQAEALAQAVRENMAPDEPAPVGAPQVGSAVESLLRMFDRTQGGFGGAPKFPQPAFCELLLEARERVDEGPRRAIDEAVRRTLDRMAVGGLRDHVGGGFHRYCVDATWTVPHFEKMLYDNALLAGLYARAAEAYGDAYYASVARDTLEYVAREMTSPEGAFWSAQDADTGGLEGATYTWTAEQMAVVLEGDDLRLAMEVYGLGRGPNFRDPHHPDEPPTNVLRMDDRPEALAERLGMAAEALGERLGAINARLLKARQQREQPGLDDKVLAAWNGMMIAGIVECAERLGEPALLDRARRALAMMEREMLGAEGLRRSWRAGKPGPAGTLEDYAWMLTAAVRLSAALGRSGEEHESKRLLELCERLYGEAAKRFGDAQRPELFYDAPASDFFVRIRSTYDGATPCASSAMLGALVELAALAGGTWTQRARDALAALSGAIAANPLATVNASRHLLRLLRLDPSLDAGVAPAPPAAEAESEEFTPVEIYADRERVTVGPDAPGELKLALRIAPDHYIYSPETTEEAGSPLRVHLVRGAGVRAYFDAPEGEPVGDGARALRGEVELRIALEREGELVGKPLLGVTFQACTEMACMAPTTVELDVAIDVTG